MRPLTKVMLDDGRHMYLPEGMTPEDYGIRDGYCEDCKFHFIDMVNHVCMKPPTLEITHQPDAITFVSAPVTLDAIRAIVREELERALKKC